MEPVAAAPKVGAKRVVSRAANAGRVDGSGQDRRRSSEVTLARNRLGRDVRWPGRGRLTAFQAFCTTRQALDTVLLPSLRPPAYVWLHDVPAARLFDQPDKRHDLRPESPSGRSLAQRCCLSELDRAQRAKISSSTSNVASWVRGSVVSHERVSDHTAHIATYSAGLVGHCFAIHALGPSTVSVT